MKAAEVHKMTDAEITEELPRLRSRLFELRSQAVTEKLENPTVLGKTRRDIARLMTELRNREAASSATQSTATQETAQ
jgi:large subunit ribosomal protein L29